MSRTSPYNVALVASLLAGSLAQAQSDGDEKTQGDMLSTLETVGQVQYRTGDVLSDENTLSSVTINREQLTATPTALAEIVSRETGVQYKQSGGFGSYATVSIRAASAAQTGVYLDGVLLNSGGNPVIDLSTLEILNLGSVDIYRGGTPSQLGHGGIGGSVNLKTLSADSDNPPSRIRLEYGSLSQAGIQASFQKSLGKWDVITALSRRQSDNDFSFVNNNGTPLNPDDDQRQTRVNAHALRSSALLQAGYQHNVDRRTDLTVQLSARELGVPEWRNKLNNQSSYDSSTNQFQLSHIIDGIGGWNSRQIAYLHTDESHFADLLGQVGLGDQDTNNRTRTQGAKSYWEYLTDNGTLGLAMEYRYETLSSDERLDRPANYDAQRRKWLGTAHYTWYSPMETVTITPSVRWQHNQFRGSRQVGTASSENANNGSDLSAQLGIGFQVSNTMSLTANIGSYFRPPSFGELFGSIGLVNGNPELIPEEGVNADLSVNYSNQSFELKGSVFASLRDQLIVTSYDSRGIGRPINSGAAEVFGLELGAVWTVSPRITVRSNFTWQSPRSLKRNSGVYNNYLPGEAQFAWFGRAEYTWKNWNTWYEVATQHTQFYDLPNILPAANITQHSVGLALTKNDWDFSVSANNLSDQNVEDFNGFPKPGRTLALVTTRSF